MTNPGMTKRVLYITPNGILEGLGYSQVFRVVQKIASLLKGDGVRYTILSMEPSELLANHSHRAHLELQCKEAGIEWIAVEKRKGRKNTLHATAQMYGEARRFCSKHRDKPLIIQARAYHAGAIAFLLYKELGVPYIFEPRGYFLDERLEEGALDPNGLFLSLGRMTERNIMAHAACVYTLTETMADDIRRGVFGPNHAPVHVCTTVTDFTAFTHDPSAYTALRDRFALFHARPTKPWVLGWMGGFNAWYLEEPSFMLAKKCLMKDPNAVFMIVTPSQEAARKAISKYGLPDAQVILTEATHEAMAKHYSLIDWVLMLLPEGSFAKRGSMPTKLGETLATGVRPILHGCNSEVRDWVQRTQGGIVLRDLEDSSLEQAAEWMLSHPKNEQGIHLSRKEAEPFFSLDAAAQRYAKTIKGFLE